MKYAIGASAALVLCMAASSSFAAEQHHRTMHVPSYIRAAVDSTSRPQSDTMRDVNRKPAGVLTFAGVKPGMKVGELEPGTGYYTRLLCRIVGDSGQVTTVDFHLHFPPPPPGAPPRRMPKMAPLGCDNVTATTQNATELMLPSDLDLVWTTENYHDFHNAVFGKPDMMTFDKAVYDALKPGGIFFIEDHAAAAGTGASDTSTLHRIDPALVKQEAEAVGFKLVASSNLLHNPNDNHTQKVFAMADKTDRFLFKFEKPRS